MHILCNDYHKLVNTSIIAQLSFVCVFWEHKVCSHQISSKHILLTVVTVLQGKDDTKIYYLSCALYILLGTCVQRVFCSLYWMLGHPWSTNNYVIFIKPNVLNQYSGIQRKARSIHYIQDLILRGEISLSGCAIHSDRKPRFHRPRDQIPSSMQLLEFLAFFSEFC
jgi:hypothetical protein